MTFTEDDIRGLVAACQAEDHDFKCFIRLPQASFAYVPKPSLVSLCSRCDLGAGRQAREILVTTIRSKSLSLTEYEDFRPTPHPDLDALGVVQTCMSALLESEGSAGLEVCFLFSSDRCRAALGGSLERFRQYASNPVFGYLVNCDEWETLSVGPIINGTATRGAMQTVLMAAKGAGNTSQTFLWTLQQERRPPLQGCWIIHEVLYVKNAYAQTL